MNNVATLAIEQCLLSSITKILSSAIVRDMEDDEIQAIAAESDETMQERARLSDRVKILEKGLGILRFHPGKYEAGPFPSGVIPTARKVQANRFSIQLLEYIESYQSQQCSRENHRYLPRQDQLHSLSEHPHQRHN